MVIVAFRSPMKPSKGADSIAQAPSATSAASSHFAGASRSTAASTTTNSPTMTAFHVGMPRAVSNSTIHGEAARETPINTMTASCQRNLPMISS